MGIFIEMKNTFRITCAILFKNNLDTYRQLKIKIAQDLNQTLKTSVFKIKNYFPKHIKAFTRVLRVLVRSAS